MSLVWQEAPTWLAEAARESRGEQDLLSQDIEGVVRESAGLGARLDQLTMLLREAGLAVTVAAVTAAAWVADAAASTPPPV